MNQKFVHPVGFLNPLLYGSLAGRGALNDITGSQCRLSPRRGLFRLSCACVREPGCLNRATQDMKADPKILVPVPSLAFNRGRAAREA